MCATSTDETQQTTLLLLVESDRNRELLTEQLEQKYSVLTPTETQFEDPQFDLCLLDTRSLGKFRDELRNIKTDTTPTFLPFLLLTGEASPDEFGTEVWEVVDEVIQRPVSKRELNSRIQNLLQRRQLSLELTRQKEQSDRRFKSLFQSTPDPVVVVEPDGTVTEANNAFAEAFGIDIENLEGRPITDFEFTPSESLERVLLKIDDEGSTTTVQWGHDDENSMVMEVNTDAIAGLGDAAERIGIFRDITARAEREQELTRQNERLQEFASTIAHDLRNPLSVARGRFELARKSGNAEHFEAVEQAHARMEQMIDELLSLAEQGQLVLDPDSVTIAEVVTQAWKHVETPSATLNCEVDSSVEILADEGRLLELFENLFRNAIDHGGADVTVTVGLLDDSAGFYVQDDGPGISAEIRDEVFEAGYTDDPEGTGFGLSIVRQIVDGHGWEITISAETQDGARFEISDVELNRG
ncbi:ATP-binding protein [Halorubrum sp. BV1]|uniref:ATP-binding protein n=1 Tax=Halorubrum sp. BV1 TaxID=1498500 RepID=UPI0006785057|nr:ATP-binding protein [Halorubrum sp. BV1]